MMSFTKRVASPDLDSELEYVPVSLSSQPARFSISVLMESSIQKNPKMEFSRTPLSEYKDHIREELRKEIEDELQEERALLDAKLLKREWEQKMKSRTRTVIRVGKDGKDEFFKEGFASERTVAFNLEIIRRCHPEDELVAKCYAPDVDKHSKVEPLMASPRSGDDAVNLKAGNFKALAEIFEGSRQYSKVGTIGQHLLLR